MADEIEIIVKTNCGSIRGRKRVSIRQEEFYSFQGIRYGKPPIGELRFKDPQRVDNWTEPFDATKDGPCAYAMALTDVAANASEDCLRLNIFTKELHPRILKPVMFWIHGGGFEIGSSAESTNGPDFLLQKDIVFVTINYRLGPMGFFSIDEEEYEIPGNAGLKDQTLALRWVSENCAYFGGDPKNITVLGCSAGGVSVHFHLISEYSKGLFHKAIVQSGSALNSWANRPKSDLNLRLAKRLGWNGEGGTKAMLNVLISADPADIILKSQNILTDLEKQNGYFFAYVPIEESYDNGHCFIPQNYKNTFHTAWGNKIPIMIGGASDEGYVMYLNYTRNKKMFDDDGYFENGMPREMNLPPDGEERKTLGATIKQFYYGDDKPTMDNLEKFIPLASDKLFWHGISAAVQDRLNDPNSAATYLYRFNFDSSVILAFKMVMCGRVVKGAIHGEDILYLVKFTSINDKIVFDSPEDRVMNIMINTWTEFATTGNPNCNAIKSIDWQPVQNDGKPLKCFNISDECSVIDLPETKRIAFWDSMHKY